jgi:hypothetical protein
MTSSITALVDILRVLINNNLAVCVSKWIEFRVARRRGQLSSRSKSTIEINNSSFYSSETLEDLKMETEGLLRSNFNNFMNILRLVFTVYTLVVALKNYGVQFHIVLFCMKLMFELLYHIAVFFVTFIDFWEVQNSYDFPSPAYMTTVSVQRQDKSRDESGHDDASDCCAICFNPHNMETVKLNACDHMFHEGCVLCLLRMAGSHGRRKNCPLCRAPIIPKTEEKDFFIPHM